MPKIAYEAWDPAAKTLTTIQQANAICTTYQQQGYILTLRQLYYQFVARDLIRNKQSEYDRLGEILNKARLAGYMDWNHLEDRTRNLVANTHWRSPDHIMEAVHSSYMVDRWQGQPTYVEVWVEKDALLGVIERPARDLDVAWFSCRGYTSQSEVWGAAQRVAGKLRRGGYQQAVIIHLGDHDPSGLQMSEDIERRMRLFLGREGFANQFDIQRIALNMDQVLQYAPPPNPAKSTDSRYAWYVDKFGTDESWELDALDPAVIDQLVRDAVEAVLDAAAQAPVLAQEAKDKALLKLATDNWVEVATWLDGNYNGNGTADEDDDDGGA